MRALAAALWAAGLAAPMAAAAAPSVEIKNAVVNVVVLPEARSDIEVRILKANPRLPLRIHTFMGRTTIDGGLWWRVRGCERGPAPSSVYVVGVGQVSPDNAPSILVRTPLDAEVAGGGAVWGRIAHANSLSLVNGGCGSWLVANVAGPLKLVDAGSGDIRTGAAGSADIVESGSGQIVTHAISGAVRAVDAGSGDIDISEVEGPLSAEVAGSGHVRVDGGRASSLRVSIQGSGDLVMSGVADSMQASVIGSGSVQVSRVTGPVQKSIIGSGQVRVGS